jgi:hypothetical protein
LGTVITAVERLGERRVPASLSGIDEEGGSAIEAFVLEPESAASESGSAD